MTNSSSVWTTGGAIMTFCGVGIGIGFIIPLFNFDLGSKIMVYSVAGLIITFIITAIVGFINEYK